MKKPIMSENILAREADPNAIEEIQKLYDVAKGQEFKHNLTANEWKQMVRNIKQFQQEIKAKGGHFPEA
jgi:hypothetical protein